MPYWKYIKNASNMTNFVTSLIHITGPLYKQFSDTQCIHVYMCTCTVHVLQCTKHCGLHQLCLAPSQVYCSLEFTFCRWLIKENRVFWLVPVALSSRVGAQTTGYLNWSRVGPQNRVFCRSQLWEPALGIVYLKVSVLEPDSLKEWNHGSDSQFGIG